MRLAEWFGRWRASRGYGVHSPLAFRIVKRVVRPDRGVCYYGEEALHDARAKLLLRFVAEMQPAYVWVSPGMPENLLEAIRLAGGVVRLYDGAVFPDDFDKADLVVLYRFELKKAQLKKILTPGHSLIGFGLKPRFIAWVGDLMKGGVILDGAGSLMAVATSDPALHSYRVSRF